MSPFKKLMRLLLPKESQQNAPTRPFVHRLPRVVLEPLHQLRFARQDPPLPELVMIANVSSQGVGFLKVAGHEWPSVGSIVKGDFLVDKQNFSVAAKITHITEKTVGCSIVAAPAEFKKAIESYFATELAAMHLSKVNSKILKQETDGIPHWYRGKTSSELFFVENEGHIQRFQISVLGFHVEGGLGVRAKFSHIIADDPTIHDDDSAKYKSSPLIKPTSSPAPELIQAALKFITNIPELSAPQKQELRQLIEGVL